MYGNPRYLGIKELFLVLLSLLWQHLKDWLHPAAGTPEAFAAQLAAVPDYVELCGVESVVYDVGSTVFAKRLLDTKDWLWWFDNRTITRLEDALTSLVSEQGDYRYLKCRAVRFELTPMFNPAYVERHGMSGCISAMDVDISNGQEFARMMFAEDESNSLPRMAQLSIERHSDDIYHVEFIGVFNVWYRENGDEDGGVSDVDICVEFVREFEIHEALKTR